jgi:ribonuclease P protein component
VRGRFRLRPAQRLSGADVTRAVGRGRTRSAGDIRLHYVSNELPFGRIAQIVPKRLARRAVDRGRLRRQAREAFRLNQARWTGYDCVVRLRAALKPDAAADAERARQLANLFERGP